MAGEYTDSGPGANDCIKLLTDGLDGIMAMQSFAQIADLIQAIREPTGTR